MGIFYKTKIIESGKGDSSKVLDHFYRVQFTPTWLGRIFGCKQHVFKPYNSFGWKRIDLEKGEFLYKFSCDDLSRDGLAAFKIKRAEGKIQKEKENREKIEEANAEAKALAELRREKQSEEGS
jgi:hypothetical protein